MVDFNIVAILRFKIINQFEISPTQMNQNQNIMFLGENVNLVHNVLQIQIIFPWEQF